MTTSVQTLHADTLSASTTFVVVNGLRVATRSIGTGDPLVLLQRFRGTLDDWDPALVSALARDRQVILFDSVVRGRERGRRARFGGTDGGLRRERHSIARAERGRFLGYSLGGFVA